jgi:hypothetical protein
MQAMAASTASSTNVLRSVLRDLGWSQTHLIAELRREAARQGVVLPKTESLVALLSRWMNNHQQPADFYRDLLSTTTGKPRAALFSDDATARLLTGAHLEVVQATAVGSPDDMNRRQLLVGTAALGMAGAIEASVPWVSGTAGVAPRQEELEILAAIRRVLLGCGPLRRDVGREDSEFDIDMLQRRVREAWQLRQSSNYLELGRLLPALLGDTQLAAAEFHGDAQARAVDLLAHTYNTASSLVRRLGDHGMGMLAADRAVQAAKTLGDPLLLGATAYRLANVFLTSRPTDAKEVALSAASSLESRLDASEAELAMWGGLQLTAAVAATREGNGGEAWELIGESKAAARRLGRDHVDLHTIFGPTSVAIQAVQVAAELGDGREVLRRARLVEPTALPPYLVERRSHFLIDVARGHAARGDDGEAVATLLEAERLGPEEVRYNPVACELLGALLKRERRAATPDLRSLSARVGLVA